MPNTASGSTLAGSTPFRRFYYVRHHIGPASRSDTPQIVRSGFDRIEAEVGPDGYLVGGAFSVADLTAAALLAPLVRPPGTLWAGLGPYPAPVEEFLEPLAARKATQWLREMYARHRGTSAAL